MQAGIPFPANDIFIIAFYMDYIEEIFFMKTYTVNNWEFSRFHDLKNIRRNRPDILDSYKNFTLQHDIN